MLQLSQVTQQSLALLAAMEDLGSQLKINVVITLPPAIHTFHSLKTVIWEILTSPLETLPNHPGIPTFGQSVHKFHPYCKLVSRRLPEELGELETMVIVLHWRES